MGWKASLIIIENCSNFAEDNQILKALGKANFIFHSKVTLEECIHPNDKSINIGYYKNNIIICDDYQVTADSLERAKGLALTKEEQQLVTIFPDSEIITVACHSVVNYHSYSIIEKGVKKRLKICTSDFLTGYGDKIAEEKEIYAKSYKKEGLHFWKDTYGGEDFTEDQLIEDFTFGIAKRRLGVSLDHPQGEELMEKVPFKKYCKESIFQSFKRKFFK